MPARVRQSTDGWWSTASGWCLKTAWDEPVSCFFKFSPSYGVCSRAEGMVKGKVQVKVRVCGRR